MRRYFAAIATSALIFASAAGAAADKPIEFVADKDYPPIVYLDQGEPKGMMVDLTRALGKKIGRDVHIELMAWELAQKKTADGEADVVGPLARSSQREEIYDFTQGCIACEYSLFVRDSDVGLHDVADLVGKPVGVTRGGYPRQLLSQQPGIELVLVDNYSVGIDQLLQGKIRALAADRWVAAYYIHERGVQGVTIVDNPLETRELAFAVKKGNTALLNSLNEGLTELRSDGVIDTIVESWAPKKVVILTQEQVRRNFLFSVAIAVALVIAALAIWIHALRKQIGQRRYAEKSLRESEARFRTLVDQAPEAIAVYDADENRYVDANAKAVELLGCDIGAIIRSSPEDYFESIEPDSPTRQSMLKNIERVFAGGEFTVERAMKNTGGKARYCEVRGVRFPATDRRLIRLSFIEITDRKMAEAELDKHRGHLEELVRERTEALEKEIAERKRIEEALRIAKDGAESANDAKSTFLASMSHEIRTPLNAILGYSHLLKRDKSLSQKHEQALASISSSGEHLLDLLSDILAMSSIEAGRTTLDESTFDLPELLHSLERMFRLRVQEKGLKLSVALDGGLPRHVRADQRKLRQILFNLMSNAVRFTDKGTLTLRVRARPAKTGEGEQSTGALTLEFEVEDTGQGIAPAEQATLFAPFAQTESGRRVQGGAGLGLAISRGFVELMGGKIGLRSEAGEGSCFSFSIQAKRADVAPLLRQPGRILRIRATNNPPRVLVVDDHPHGRKLLKELLDSAGFDVRTAANGQEALRTWDAWRPHFILMDMNLPIMDGYQATREILKMDAAKQTIIVALTASVFEEDRERILSAGCADCLLKPFREEAIFNCLAKHLGLEYERESTVAEPVVTESLESIAEKIHALPPQPLARLRQATRMLDAEALAEVAETLSAEHPVVAQFMRRSAEQLDFGALDRIINEAPKR